MNPNTKRVATAATAITVGAAALIGSAITAPQASAAPVGVPDGRYTFTTYSYGFIPNTMTATIGHGRIKLSQLGASRSIRLHQVRGGAWFNDNVQHFVLRPRGHHRYGGNITIGVVPTGHTTLVPRR